MKEFIVENINALLSVLSVFISAASSIYLDQKMKQAALLEERYKKVYFPIYKELKVILYRFDLLNQQESQEVLIKIKLLLEREELLAGFRLYNTFLTFYENQTEKNYVKFCNLFFNEYIYFSKRLGLTGMSQKYRARNKLYTKSQLRSYYLSNGAFILLTAIIIFYLLFVLFIIVYIGSK